ncbi:MAG: hypothetical protein JW976_03645 [Syntrophaceae bacterium]|nr:hypothetical protein [Syntrophaceae bacterium]
MNYDKDKVDELTLSLLYLVAHERREGCGAVAWKGFDWETMNRLYNKGYISNPVGKSKSVVMTEAGFLKAKELFEKHFSADAKTVSLPKFTSFAKKRWHQIPEMIRKDLMNNVWCGRCRSETSMQLREGVLEQRSLVLRGTCKRCGGEVARVIESED